MPASYIADGYDREGYIRASEEGDNGERLYDSVTFEYRVAPRPEVMALDSELRFIEIRMSKASNAAEYGKLEMQQERKTCEFIASHLIRWDVTDKSGQDVPITADTLLHLHATLIFRLHGIIRCSQLSDQKPDAPAIPTDEESTKN